MPDPLETFLARAIRSGEFPGCAYALRRRGRLIRSGGLGHAALQPERDPAGPQTVYDLASLTKPLCTALLCALLSERRELQLSARAASFLPPLRGSAAGAASVAQLLTHTAGLPPWVPLYAYGRGRKHYLRTLARIRREQRDPSLAHYSDLGYLIVGWVLEKVVGRTLDSAFDELVAGPLGLQSTRFGPPPAWKERCAASERACRYERRQVRELGLSYRGFPRAAPRGRVHDQNAAGLGGVAGHAGLFATADEAALLAEQYLPRRSRLLQPSTCARFLRPWTRKAGQHWALAGELASCADVRQSPPLAPNAVGLVGFTGTSAWIERGEESVYVLLTNRHHPLYRAASFHPHRCRFHALAKRQLLPRAAS